MHSLAVCSAKKFDVPVFRSDSALHGKIATTQRDIEAKGT
jgi:hypothetical protein